MVRAKKRKRNDHRSGKCLFLDSFLLYFVLFFSHTLTLALVYFYSSFRSDVPFSCLFHPSRFSLYIFYLFPRVSQYVTMRGDDTDGIKGEIRPPNRIKFPTCLVVSFTKVCVTNKYFIFLL